MRVSVLKSMFANHLKEGMVVMNVNGGFHFTYLGMVRASTPEFIISELIHNIVHNIHQNCFVSISLIVSILGWPSATRPWFWRLCTWKRRE
jgi:uncharacterized membrane-anchored protein YitT (DUF2179 family)